MKEEDEEKEKDPPLTPSKTRRRNHRSIKKNGGGGGGGGGGGLQRSYSSRKRVRLKALFFVAFCILTLRRRMSFENTLDSNF